MWVLTAPRGTGWGLCYACTDDAGLRYEFPLFEILTWKWDGTERYPISGRAHSHLGGIRDIFDKI